MPKAIKIYIVIYVIVSLNIIASGFATGAEQREVTRNALNFMIPNPLGSKPFYEFGDANGKFQGIHIPFLYDMEFHFRGGNSIIRGYPSPFGILDTKFSMSVLAGYLLRATYDRPKLADGQRHGPLELYVLNIPLYDNKEEPYDV